MKLFDNFKEQRERHGDEPAFLIGSGDRSIPISWRQFTDDIAAVAWIIRQGCPGGKVGILGENSYEWFVCHAACVLSGAVAVPVDYNLRAEQMAERLRFVGASAFVNSSLYADKAREVRKLCPGILGGGFGSLKTDFYLMKARLALKSEKSIWDEPPRDSEEIATIVFTSGTTSEPRGAELALSAIEQTCESWGSALEMQRGNRTLMMLPLHHIFGVCASYVALCRGVALGVCPDFRRLYDTVERFHANFLFLVPALAELLAKKIEKQAGSAEEAFGQPLDWILTGGAPLPRRTYEHLTALGVKVIFAYGCTETAAMYSVGPSVGDPHVGSAGRIDPSGAIEYKTSETGELLLRGKCVMRDYFKRPEHTAKVLTDGWYHTGDLGHIDEDGFVWITGRASRTIILTSGKKIAPEELEDQLLSLPGILETRVSGDPETREIRAEIYGSISEDRIRRTVAEYNLLQPLYKRISKVIIRSEPFPRTSSGKIKV